MNKLKMVLALIIVSTLAGSGAIAENFSETVRQGNEAFGNQQYDLALEKYQNAETERPESAELDYNMAGVMYQQGKYEEAVEKFNRALNSQEIALETKAHYNLGNTYYRMGDFPNAIKSYENALTNDPNDVNAKFNLELSRKMLKEQMKPDEQEQKEQQQQEQQQQEQQEQQQQDQQQDEQQDEDQQQQQQDSGEQDKKDQQKKEQQQQEKPIWQSCLPINSGVKSSLLIHDSSTGGWILVPPNQPMNSANKSPTT